MELLSLSKRGDFGIPIQGLRPQCRVLRPVLRRPVLRRPVLRRPVLRRPVLRRPVLRRLVTHRLHGRAVWPTRVLPHTTLRSYEVTEVSPLRGFLQAPQRSVISFTAERHSRAGGKSSIHRPKGDNLLHALEHSHWKEIPTSSKARGTPSFEGMTRPRGGFCREAGRFFNQERAARLGRPFNLDVYDSVGGVETQVFASLRSTNHFIHLTTVTRCVLTPFSVAMRTMYTPALN